MVTPHHLSGSALFAYLRPWRCRGSEGDWVRDRASLKLGVQHHRVIGTRKWRKLPDSGIPPVSAHSCAISTLLCEDKSFNDTQLRGRKCRRRFSPLGLHPALPPQRLTNAQHVTSGHVAEKRCVNHSHSRSLPTELLNKAMCS